jgi:hypothetical protein
MFADMLAGSWILGAALAKHPGANSRAGIVVSDSSKGSGFSKRRMPTESKKELKELWRLGLIKHKDTVLKFNRINMKCLIPKTNLEVLHKEHQERCLQIVLIRLDI